MNLAQAYGPDGRPREGVSLTVSTLPALIDACTHWSTRPDRVLEALRVSQPPLAQVVPGSVPDRIVAAIRESGRMLTLKELRSTLPTIAVQTLKQSLARLLWRTLVYSDGKRRLKRYGLVKK